MALPYTHGRAHATVTAVCFEALLRPHDAQCRARLDALERALCEGGLPALPMPAFEELN